MKPASAASAEKRSCAVNTSAGSVADESAVRLVAYETAGFADVYDLEVEGAHEFFANGILVHNCLRYGTKSALKPRSTPFPVVAAEKRLEMEQSGRSMTEVAIQMKKIEHENRHKGRRKSSWAR